jgi:hypothetical protein
MRLQSEISGHLDLAEIAQSRSLTTRFYDFWLLGGASVALGLVMFSTSYLRGKSPSIDESFAEATGFFALLSIVCNHPHFMLSYRFGYGRGWRFIASHLFSLVVVPVTMIAVFFVAYFNFGRDVSGSTGVKALNWFYETTGWGFQFGTLSSLGAELLGMSVWAMYLTMGWHYSKQVFGCVLVYNKYDGYVFSQVQKRLLKWSVFSVAFFNFCYFAEIGWNEGSKGHLYFSNAPITPIAMANWLIWVAGASMVLAALSLLYFGVLANYRRNGTLPSINAVVPWVALHVWWIPMRGFPEFYLLAVPFFHSLQYLPFAYRMERKEIRKGHWYYFNITARLSVLLIIGFLAFSFVPSTLDQVLKTEWLQTQWFFVTAFVVFINVHHFFIDSVVWKFDQSQVRASLFDAPSTSQAT